MAAVAEVTEDWALPTASAGGPFCCQLTWCRHIAVTMVTSPAQTAHLPLSPPGCCHGIVTTGLRSGCLCRCSVPSRTAAPRCVPGRRDRAGSCTGLSAAVRSGLATAHLTSRPSPGAPGPPGGAPCSTWLLQVGSPLGPAPHVSRAQPTVCLRAALTPAWAPRLPAVGQVLLLVQ